MAIWRSSWQLPATRTIRNSTRGLRIQDSVDATTPDRIYIPQFERPRSDGPIEEKATPPNLGRCLAEQLIKLCGAQREESLLIQLAPRGIWGPPASESGNGTGRDCIGRTGEFPAYWVVACLEAAEWIFALHSRSRETVAHCLSLCFNILGHVSESHWSQRSEFSQDVHADSSRSRYVNSILRQPLARDAASGGTARKEAACSPLASVNDPSGDAPHPQENGLPRSYCLCSQRIAFNSRSYIFARL